jgi:hypothetical protein
MSRDQLHEIANGDAPQSVCVPNSWPALIVWAFGRFGVGVIFALMLIYVYQDLQTTHRAMVQVVQANATAIHSLARETGETNRKIEDIERHIRRTP